MEFAHEEHGMMVFEDSESSLVVNITGEGIIMDCWALDANGDGIHVGTRGMTFDEWFDFIIELDPLGRKEHMREPDGEFVTGHRMKR